MSEAFWTHTFEILAMLLVAFSLGLWLGYVLWHKWHQLYLDQCAEYDALIARLKKVEDENTDLKVKLKKCQASKTIPVPVAQPDPDDLRKIEGIGPKIEKLCNGIGVYTWQQLADTSVDKLKKMLEDAGPSFSVADPHTWPDQAKMAAEGKWDDLEEYQDYLDGGRDPARTRGD